MIRIGTRESELAVWQANWVKNLLESSGHPSKLEFIKSEGDVDHETPLYEMGVQGIFTRSLDVALLNNKIDLAVHSMKDVPTSLPKGIVQAAVLKRGNHRDLFVMNPNIEGEQAKLATALLNGHSMDGAPLTIATSSIRRKAQWLHLYPNHVIENLRGNVNTRLRKVNESNWQGAIFAAAGLERINLRPADAVELNWMLPAPAQGAVVVVCRQEDETLLHTCRFLNDDETALCTKIEREFLRELLGGCSTPISALALADKNEVFFRGNILTPDGKQKADIEKHFSINEVSGMGKAMALELLNKGGREIASQIRNAE
jgi:hydroxymethylbilane synthase